MYFLENNFELWLLMAFLFECNYSIAEEKLKAITPQITFEKRAFLKFYETIQGYIDSYIVVNYFKFAEGQTQSGTDLEFVLSGLIFIASRLANKSQF